MFFASQTFETPALEAKTTDHKLLFFFFSFSIRDPSPGLSMCYLGRRNVIHAIKWTRPSPLFLHTASNQKLDGEKAWE